MDLCVGRARIAMEAVTKFEMEKFDGKGDFGMWKFKMLMQLELQGLGKVLQGESCEGSSEKDDVDSKVQTREEPDPKPKEKDTRARNLILKVKSYFLPLIYVSTQNQLFIKKDKVYTYL